MSRFPSDFLNAQDVLNALRNGSFLFSESDYKIAFDDKISREDLAELEAKFLLEGYIYDGVGLYVIGKNPPYKDSFFAYPMKKKK